MAIWTGQPKKRAAFSPCVRGSWKLSPNPKLDVFDNTLGLCLTFPNSDGFRPPRFSPTYPFSSSLMTTGCIFSIFANFIALAFTSDRRFEKNFARDFIALAPSPVTYLSLQTSTFCAALYSTWSSASSLTAACTRCRPYAVNFDEWLMSSLESTK